MQTTAGSRLDEFLRGEVPPVTIAARPSRDGMSWAEKTLAMVLDHAMIRIVVWENLVERGKQELRGRMICSGSLYRYRI